jgi:hypothetical protein
MLIRAMDDLKLSDKLQDVSLPLSLQHFKKSFCNAAMLVVSHYILLHYVVDGYATAHTTPF